MGKNFCQLTDHSCRHCMGPLLRREADDGAMVVRCAECGTTEHGGHSALCWCGVEIRGHSAVFECFRNPNVTLAVPQEVLVREIPLVVAPEKPIGRICNPVRIEGYY